MNLAQNKYFLSLLVLLNAMVLLGQIWPEGVPPFAKTVNLLFLTLSFLFFIYLLIKHKK